MNDQPEQLTPVGATTFAAIMDGIADKQAADLHHTSVEDNANRAEACANGDCIHARNGARAARIAAEYRTASRKPSTTSATTATASRPR